MPHSPDAVCFADRDYAHVTRRVGAFLIDLFVIIMLTAVFGQVAGKAVVPEEVRNMPDTAGRQELINKYEKPIQIPITLGWLGSCLLYLVGARKLRGGTLGYRMMGICLVDKAGKTPSLRTLLKRFVIAVIGTAPLGAAYIMCIRDPKRQAMHDRWSGTWLVRLRPQPAGPAMTAYQTKLFGTFLLTYVDVEPFVPDAGDAEAGRRIELAGDPSAEPRPPSNNDQPAVASSAAGCGDDTPDS